MRTKTLSERAKVIEEYEALIAKEKSQLQADLLEEEQKRAKTLGVLTRKEAAEYLKEICPQLKDVKTATIASDFARLARLGMLPRATKNGPHCDKCFTKKMMEDIRDGTIRYPTNVTPEHFVPSYSKNTKSQNEEVTEEVEK